MKLNSVPRLVLSACFVGALMAPATSSALDLDKLNPLNLFSGKKDDKKAPTAEEKASQDAAADAMLRDAHTAASTGSEGKAQSIYKDIVSKYPFSDAAGEAQFSYAVLVRKNGKLEDAFDAFQKLIKDHRQSPRFADAIEQQFSIAEEAKGGKKQTSMLLIPMKVDASKTVEMYRTVIKNAPYGRYAPLAQFAIGEVFQDQNEKSKSTTAFQDVVDNYPNTPQAAEAQFRVGAITSTASRKTQDASNLVTARDALETYRTTHPTGERMNEVETELNKNKEVSAQKSYAVAEFYAKSGKPKAAAIYYNDAIKYGTPEAALKAREKLAALAAAHGEELKKNTDVDQADYTPAAAVNLKTRDEYAGPPAPELAAAGRKPKMRVERDEFKPIPVQEPELPTRGNNGTAPGMLVPPTSSPTEGRELLPIPPAPSNMTPPTLAPPTAPGSLPVPPKPEEQKPALPK